MSFGEIKKAVNSNLDKPLNVLIEEKTGAVNASGGTASAGGIFAKLNKLLTDWTTARAGKIDTIATDVGTVKTNVGTLINGRVVKSVQRGIVEINTNSTTSYNVAINSVDTSKTMVIIDTSAGIHANWVVSSLGSTSFTAVFMTANSGLSKLSWQVIEFY